MIIIWGSRNRISTRDIGTFFCPDCGSHQDYRHKVAKEWFTLYFIPIFPTSTLGEFVECQACMNTYGPEILDLSEEEIRAALDHDPEAVQREFHSCLLTTTVLAADLCGLEGEAADTAVTRQYRESTGVEADPTVIRAVRDNPAIDEKRLLEELRALREQLNDTGKTMVLEAAWGVAGDGEQRELAAFSHRLGSALELPTGQVQAFIDKRG